MAFKAHNLFERIEICNLILLVVVRNLCNLIEIEFKQIIAFH